VSLPWFPVGLSRGRLADSDCRMILIACVLLACFPPGILFPQMAARMSARARKGGHVAEESEKQEKGATGVVPDSNRSE
jgi:hypothetical protein